MIPRRTQINNAYLKMIADRKQKHPNTKEYFLTLTFDPNRDRVSRCNVAAIENSRHITPDRYEIAAGLTTRMTPADFKNQLDKDLNLFYVQLIRILIGRDFSQYPEKQPLGIGYFDEPAPLKRKSSQSVARMRKTANAEFVHAHIVLCIYEPEQIRVFEEMMANGRLERIWEGINSQGSIDVRDAYDAKGLLRYSGKNAGTVFDGEDAQILWPAIKGQSLIEREQAMMGMPSVPGTVAPVPGRPGGLQRCTIPVKRQREIFRQLANVGRQRPSAASPGAIVGSP